MLRKQQKSQYRNAVITVTTVTMTSKVMKIKATTALSCMSYEKCANTLIKFLGEGRQT